MHAPEIRLATEADLQRLVVIEVEAGEAFLTVGMTEVAQDVPDLADLREAVAAERLWVTEVASDVAAYVTAEVLDGNAHVAQVSVAPAYAGRALGRALIEFVEKWGRAADLPATTLTTFRDVPWNGPYYRRIGYRELPEADVGPQLAMTMAQEASLPGIDPALRCAMIKPNRRDALG